MFVVKAKNIGFAQLYCGREKRQQGLLSAVNPKRFFSPNADLFGWAVTTRWMNFGVR